MEMLTLIIYGVFAPLLIEQKTRNSSRPGQVHTRPMGPGQQQR